MRDVLFRGKRKDNGKWVYGSYLKKLQYCVVGHLDVICDNEWGHEYEVSKDTVGQYTGLMDKNGVKIFDGDRVIVPMYRMENHVPNFMKGTVEWRNGAFHVTWDDEKYGRHFLGYLQDVEVIGNMQENQEMLTGDGQCS